MQRRIGAYLRVSTEEQANIIEGSLDSQKHRLNSFVEIKNSQENKWGKITEFYIEEGLSAKDTRRPQFQKLMSDIRKGKIDLILVTDLSRLSRNMLDFLLLLEEIKKYNTKFLSVKEQFDTTTPSGEMMMLNLINLAQFERKQTAERVSLNFHSRAKRGLRNGAPVILGFDIDETNRSIPKVNEKEAVIVRNIFNKFLEIGTLRGTVVYLNAKGIKPKKVGKRLLKSDALTIWFPQTLHEFLRNPAYVGLKEVNKKYKDEDAANLPSWQKYEVVKASWPAIVDKGTFDIVQSSLNETRLKERQRLSKSTRREFLLSSFFECESCGKSISGHTCKGRSAEYRYYDHKSQPGPPTSCKVQRFRADEVESLVINHLKEMLSRSGAFDDIEDNLSKIGAQKTNDVKAEIQSVEKEIHKIDLDIESTFQILSKMSDSGSAINLAERRLENLNSEREKKVNRKHDLEDCIPDSVDHTVTREFIHSRWEEFKKGWDKGTGAQKKRLLRRLIHKLVPTDGGFKVFYVTGTQEYIQGTQSPGVKTQVSGVIEMKTPQHLHAEGIKGNFTNAKDSGLGIVKIGAGDGSRTRNPQLGRLIL